jgi:acyl carrier protein
MRNDPALTPSLQALFAETLQVPPELITPDLAFGDIPQWDSLGHMEVMLRLEEQFGVSVDADTIAQLVSIPEICEYLAAHSASSNRPM